MLRALFVLLLAVVGCAAEVEQSGSPAPVLYSIDAEMTTLGAEIAEAADLWSTLLEQRVFEQCAPDDSRPHVHVSRMTADDHSDHAGWTTWSRRGPLSATQGTLRLRVDHMARLPAHQAFGIIVHEFGHVLNVDHEQGDHNVMRDTFVPEDWEISAASLEVARHFVTH